MAAMTLEDQKRRTLEALERRFSVAKAELLQEQQKTRQIVEGDEGFAHDANYSSSVPSPAHHFDASVRFSLNTPSTKENSAFSVRTSSKGNSAFSARTTSKDEDANDPTYAQLSHSVHENLLATNKKLSSKKGSMVDKMLHELLQNGDSAQKYMQGSRSKKIDNWILLDNFVPGRGASVSARARAMQIHSKRSKKRMSMKQHKKNGTLELSKELHKFEFFKPMHDIWKGYVMQLLKNIGKNQLAPCLLNADLHGAIIQVAECKTEAFTGMGGIMIRETGETFGIVTENGKFRVVPKKGSVFIFQVDTWKITLHGDKLISRSLGS